MKTQYFDEYMLYNETKLTNMVL